MDTPYINGRPVTFRGAEMTVTFLSGQRVASLNPERHSTRRELFVYTFTYSPSAQSALNGIAAAAIAKADLPFVAGLLGGVKLANVYAEMKAKHAAMLARRPRQASRECTCGRCFDCVAA
jgi:hypothetical protein